MLSKLVCPGLYLLIFFLVASCGGGGGGGSSAPSNRSPSANAGSDQIVNEGDQVTLSASASSDSDGQITSYSWTQSSGSTVSLDVASEPETGFIAPAADGTPLVFRLQITDNDGASSTDEVSITVNQPPLADAGSDSIVNEGDQVTLSATVSSDSDGEITGYSWTQSSGSNVSLDTPDESEATFIAPASDDTPLVFQLQITDNDGASDSDEVSITVNQAPLADAGSDQIVNEGDQVTLSATASSDSDGEITSYSWTQLSGSNVSLDALGESETTFIAPAADGGTPLVFQLEITDDGGASTSDEVSVAVNQPPFADAGINKTVLGGETVVLNATGSSDPDGAIVRYTWIQTSGQQIALANTTEASIEFSVPNPSVNETLTFEVQVEDDLGLTTADSVQVSIDPAVIGQAKLGPIELADIELFLLPDLDNPIYFAGTTEGETLDTTGLIRFPKDIIEPGSLYLIQAIGGQDVDIEDDDQRDAIATPMRGILHGIYTGQHLIDGEWRLSAVTELAYQRVKSLLLAGVESTSSITIDALNGVAENLLDADITGDSLITHDDLVVWDAVADKHVFSGDITPFNISILSDSDIEINASEFLAISKEVGDTEDSPTILAQDKGLLFTSTFDANTGVNVYEAASPPVFLGNIELPALDDVRDLAVEGGYLYVASSTSTAILNVEDISDPSTVASIPANVSWAIDVSGNVLIQGSDFGVQVYDISDKSSPQVMSRLATNTANDIVIDGSRLYVGTAFGYVVVDISSPLVLSDTRVSSQWIDTALAVEGGYLYFSSAIDGLKVIDVSNGENPSEVGHIDLDVKPRGMGVSNSRAFIASGSSGTIVVDIGDRGNPTLIGELDTSSFSEDVEIANSLVFVADGSQLMYLKHNLNPRPHYVLHSIFASIASADISGENLFFVSSDGNLEIFDFGGDSPRFISQVNSVINARNLIVDSGLVYVAADERLLEIFNVGNLDFPISVHADNRQSWGPIAVKDRFVYLLEFHSDPLLVVDANNLLDVKDVNTIKPSGVDSIFDVLVSGEQLIVATDAGTFIYDATDPGAPIEVDMIPGQIRAVAVNSDALYTLDFNNRISFYDISSPQAPEFVTSLVLDGLDGVVIDIDVLGDYLYLVEHVRSMMILDVSDLSNPKVFARYAALKPRVIVKSSV